MKYGALPAHGFSVSSVAVQPTSFSETLPSALADADVEMAQVGERSRSKRGIHLPHNFSGQKVAGKASKVAGKASRAASKKASKMASAFAKKLRRPHHSEAGGSAADLAEVVGVRQQEAAELDDLDADDSSGEEEQSWCCETSAASTDRPRSAEGHSRSLGGQSTGSEPGEALCMSGGSSDSDPTTSGRGRGRGRSSTPEPERRSGQSRSQEVSWDAKAFGKVRPLELQSIWDIPTSRVPQPPVRPKPLPVPVVTVETQLVASGTEAGTRGRALSSGAQHRGGAAALVAGLRRGCRGPVVIVAAVVTIAVLVFIAYSLVLAR